MSPAGKRGSIAPTPYIGTPIDGRTAGSPGTRETVFGILLTKTVGGERLPSDHRTDVASVAPQPADEGRELLEARHAA